MRVFGLRRCLWACAFLGACSASPPQHGATPPLRSACSAASGDATPRDGTATTDLRRSIEAGPIYSAAQGAGLAACTVSYESDAIVLDYQFRDGGSLHVKRDPSIEYTEQEARFVSPPRGDPADVLKRAEHFAFGATGCGIEWQHAETQPSDDDQEWTETVFRGDVCNCQARIRRDAGGRVVAMALRSAC